MPKVTAAEGKHIKVARFLTEKGFLSVGFTSRINSVDPLSYIVDIQSMLVQRRFLLWRWRSPSDFIPGRLFLVNPHVGATKKNWVMHVNGREIFETMQEVAEQLLTEFKVDIHVRLEQEELEYPPATDQF